MDGQKKRVKDLVRATHPPLPRTYTETKEKRFQIEKVVRDPEQDVLSYSTAGGNIIYLKKVGPEPF